MRFLSRLLSLVMVISLLVPSSSQAMDPQPQGQGTSKKRTPPRAPDSDDAAAAAAAAGEPMAQAADAHEEAAAAAAAAAGANPAPSDSSGDSVKTVADLLATLPPEVFAHVCRFLKQRDLQALWDPRVHNKRLRFQIISLPPSILPPMHATHLGYFRMPRPLGHYPHTILSLSPCDAQSFLTSQLRAYPHTLALVCTNENQTLPSPESLRHISRLHLECSAPTVLNAAALITHFSNTDPQRFPALTLRLEAAEELTPDLAVVLSQVSQLHLDCFALPADVLDPLLATLISLPTLHPLIHTLNLASCTALTALPESLGQPSSLQTLDLRGCIALQDLPASLGQLTSLTTLNLGGGTP